MKSEGGGTGGEGDQDYGRCMFSPRLGKPR